MSKDYELDFDTVSQNRKTVKDVVTASKQVRGDTVIHKDGYALINTPPANDVDGAWEFETLKPGQIITDLD